MPFRNSILAGTTLVREAVQSQDYAAGTAGWTINADGSAEFNDITIRGGTVVSGTALYYDPAPGEGALIMSIAAEAGTDEYGNAYERGVTWYEAGTPAVQVGDDLPNLFGMSGVSAYDADSNRLVALTNGSVAFLPTDQTFARSAGIGMLYLDDYSPAIMRMQLLSGRPESGQRYALMNLDSATTGARAEVSVAADNASPADLRFSVHGETQLKGQITEYDSNTFDSYVPTVTGGGTVTWTTRTGWWQRIGDMVFVCVHLQVAAAGSGTGIVNVAMPTDVYRGTRQVLTMHTESVGPNGSHVGDGQCVFFTGAASTMSDRLRTSSNNATNADANLLGQDLLAGGVITIEGWYRAA